MFRELYVKDRVFLRSVRIDGDGYALILMSFMLRKLGRVAGRRNFGGLVIVSICRSEADE